MKRILLIVFCVIPVLGGCGGAEGIILANQMVALAPSVMASQMGEKNAVTPTSDADLSKIVLAEPMSPEVFVSKAKAAIASLGYQRNSLTPVGTGVMVIATKQVMSAGGLFGSRRNFSYTRVTMTLSQDGKTVDIDVSTTGSGDNPDERSAAQKINDFRNALIGKS